MAFRNIHGAKLYVSSALRLQNHVLRTGREVSAMTSLPTRLARRKSTKTNLQEDAQGASLRDGARPGSAPGSIVWHSLSSSHQHPELDLTFANGKEAYKSKKTSELVRALFVFNLCSVEALVNRQKEVSDMMLWRTQLCNTTARWQQ